MELLKQFDHILEKSKKELQQLAQEQAAEINSSGSSEVAFVALSKFEILIKELKDHIKEDAIFEVEQGRDHALGASIKVMNITRYDYSNCGDAELNKMEVKIKEKKEFLKSLKKPTNIVDEETGEVLKLLPPSKKVTETLKLLFS